MDAVLNFIDTTLKRNSDVLLTLVVFGAVFLGVIGASLVFAKGRAQRRLEEQTTSRQLEERKQKTEGSLSVRYGIKSSPVSRIIRPLQKYIEPKDATRRSTVRRQLIQAGYMSPSAVTKYYGIRLLLAIGLPLAFITIAPIVSRGLTVQTVLIIGMASGLVGLYLPRVWVSQRIQKRQVLAREGFPDSLDMLLVCVEAGLGLNAALQRVGEEIARAHPLLATQFKLVGLELQAGKSREMALRNLSERIGIDEVKSLVTLLIQSEQLGTSVGQALRVHAADMRIKRMLRAEEKAHMLPVKMAFPLIGFILPCLIIVILSPAIIRIIRVLLPTMRGG